MRLARASFRLEMAELERIWAIVSAHREGLSVRDIARGCSLRGSMPAFRMNAKLKHATQKMF